jgi:hypothetical protein
MFAAFALMAAAPLAAVPEMSLQDQIRAQDDRFFALFFDARCHVDEVRAMLADDVEMYHDKGGVVATNAAQFMTDYEKSCAARTAPDAWRSRRELVPGSLRVDPVPGFGAIEDGEHRFYERRGDGAERLAGSASFTQLWVKQTDGWKLKRIFSFAHRAAQ